jgi:acetylornithine deacetylase
MTRGVSTLFELIRELVDIPSVTGEEGAVAAFVEKRLGERGFRVRLQEVETGRHNVYALTDGQPKVVLCTHLDTVPPFYASSEDDEYIYGRGACDAKGCLAAMVEAATQLHDQNVRGLGLLFVVGEEVDSIGAKTANRLEPGSSFVLVGEPTESRMASGHKGTFGFVLRVRGRAAHSAYPHLGDSAIERLMDALGKIRRADWGQSPLLGPATVNVGTLSGGVAANVIAAEAQAEILVRVAGKAADAEATLRGIIGSDSSIDYRVFSKKDAVTCETLPGFDVAPVSFGTDIPSLTEFGKPLLFGPGSIRDAHGAREKIGKREAARAVELYYQAASDLLERAS